MDCPWTEIRLDTPGTGFEDSFLLGNGRFGASLRFRPDRESILLSHGAFWSGGPARSHGRPGAPAAFRKARELSLRGDHAGAYDALKDFIGEKENYGTNLPVGRLVAEQVLSAPEAYERRLSITEGTAGCSFLHDGHWQTREAVCLENPAVLEMIFRDSAPMRITFSLEGPCLTGRKAAGDLLLFEARARETVHSDGTCGTCLAGGIRARAEGKVTAGPDFLQAEGTEIRLRLTMETDYSMEENSCRIPGGMDALREKVRDTLEREWDGPHGAAQTTAERTLEEEQTLSGETQTMAEHTLKGEQAPAGAAQAPAAHRMREGSAQRPGLTPRVELEGEPQISRQVLFGHGLLRAAVTPDSPLPPALQGVWNDEEACRLGWSNDYHLDVNTQMNLWCAETLGEGERLAPLFRFLLRRLIPEGRKTAAGYYGLPGAVAELSTNCFGYAAPYWGRPLAPCPACGFWLCEIVIRHALNHPEDTGFLNQTAIPVLRPFTEFALAYVISDGKGHLAGGPAVSPENGFRAEDRTFYASMGTTFENEQMRILLDGYVRITRMTGASDELAERAAATLSGLLPLRIDSRGEIGEYAHDLPSAVPHHRHLSHLSGLYPGRSITPEDTELAEAAERTIRARILPEEDFESTPWARVMLGLYEARLGHGEQALAQLEYMMKHHGSPSLLLMHPAIPGTQNPRPVWEMDGNTGFVEVVLEMLVQGSENRVRLLPALPARWKKGRIRDIQAGPWKLEEMSWDMPGRLEARLRGQPGKKPEICWNGRRIVRTVPECGELILRENDWG